MRVHALLASGRYGRSRGGVLRPAVERASISEIRRDVNALLSVRA